MHDFFSNTTPQFGSLRDLSQKLIWRRTKLLSDEESHGLGIHDESHGKKEKWPIICFVSAVVFGLRSPVVQKPFQTKSVISIVARVSSIPHPKLDFNEAFYIFLALTTSVVSSTNFRVGGNLCKLRKYTGRPFFFVSFHECQNLTNSSNGH